jgi:hypothetical protein
MYSPACVFVVDPEPVIWNLLRTPLTNTKDLIFTDGAATLEEFLESPWLRQTHILLICTGGGVNNNLLMGYQNCEGGGQRYL